MKILVIEDEQDIREGLCALLEDRFEVTTASSGLSGLKSVVRQLPDLILLDLNMPDMDGYQTCKALRTDPDFSQVPIIILTAFNNSNDRTCAYELGADDFIAKPFDNTELLARIQRKLDIRQTLMGKTQEASTTGCGNLTIKRKTQDVFIDGQNIHLSGVEYSLLVLLVEHRGVLISRQKIIEKVWQGEEVSDRIMDPHILSLRNKLAGFDHTITAIYGKGYVLK